ncbi:hypothetical protein AMECASPLE_025116 [Ameca splendens]|uniref:Uncharacterized protein n=1 Tax=Ameca splendens TaxID=208324 RepID=A0ABV0XTK0_9TELE
MRSLSKGEDDDFPKLFPLANWLNPFNWRITLFERLGQNPHSLIACIDMTGANELLISWASPGLLYRLQKQPLAMRGNDCPRQKEQPGSSSRSFQNVWKKSRGV